MGDLVNEAATNRAGTNSPTRQLANTQMQVWRLLLAALAVLVLFQAAGAQTRFTYSKG